MVRRWWQLWRWGPLIDQDRMDGREREPLLSSVAWWPLRALP
jgi:hypothetical protein